MVREVESGSGVYKLSDEERAAVRAGMADARRGDFAAEQEIEKLYRSNHPLRRHSGARVARARNP
jgi:predicted transcriptional regulator